VANNDYALEVQGVSKRFRRGEKHSSLRETIPAMTRKLFRRNTAADRAQQDFWALTDVGFQVKRGEAFGIIGGNGAGKSTMLKLLTGIMHPTSGSIRIAGRVSALIEVGAGFHRDLTGRENVFMNGAILGLSKQEIEKRFDAIVEFSGLEEFIDTPVKRYSSGMFARLGFSVAAHVDPDVLLVDEVLSVGDYVFQRKCVERMNAVIASGVTIVFVSHNLRELANLCTTSMLLEKGKVAMIGPTEDVISTYFGRGQQARVPDLTSGVTITKVAVRDEHGSSVDFTSGGKLSITVEAQGMVRHDDMSVVVQIVDDHQYPVFDTCTQRLGAGEITVDQDESLRCTFEMDNFLARGTFHVNVYLHRYLTDLPYDRWMSAATFFVSGAPEARGAVTLHPKLTECEVGPTVGAAANPPRRAHDAQA
jgi:lipopolysaccharide transport system ATP-binding protein